MGLGRETKHGGRLAGTVDPGVIHRQVSSCLPVTDEETIAERLAQDLEDMALELGQLIQEQDAVVRQRHLTGHGQLTTADHADIGNGMVRRAKGTRGDDGGVAAGPAGDTVGASGVQDFGQRHGWQDSGEPTGQDRYAFFCRPQQQMIADQNSTA
jgi:hypothetical protein